MPSTANEEFLATLAKIFVSFDIMVYSNDLFKMLSSMGQMGKISLSGKWVIWSKLPYIYATLYLIIHSKDICEMLIRYYNGVQLVEKCYI